MITATTIQEFKKTRDEEIFEEVKTHAYKVVAAKYKLSPSRIKTICMEQRKKHQPMTNDCTAPQQI